MGKEICDQGCHTNASVEPPSQHARPALPPSQAPAATHCLAWRVPADAVAEAIAMMINWMKRILDFVVCGGQAVQVLKEVGVLC